MRFLRILTTTAARLRTPAGRWQLARALMLRLPRRPRLSRRAAGLLRAARTPAGRERILLGLGARIAPILHLLARGYRRVWIRKTRIIAVVGSFGKTTTTRAIAASLGAPEPSELAPNAGSALDLKLLRLSRGTRHAVLEVGVSRHGQMVRYARQLRPDLVVVTCIGSEHMTSFGSLEATRREKSEMVRALSPSGTAILNGDDPNVVWMRRTTPASVVLYGTGRSNDVRAAAIEVDGAGRLRFVLHVDGETHLVKSQLVGRHMVYPILAAVAVARACGIPVSRALAALQTVLPTPNRLQPIEHASGAILLLDAYKSALETIERAFDAAASIPSARTLVVLGDVEEPPGSQGPIYKALGARLAEVADDALFVGGKTNYQRLRVGTTAAGRSRDWLQNASGGARDAAERLIGELRDGDLVLIKGRCTQHLERIAYILLGEPVACTLKLCRRRHNCSACPFLQHAR